MPAPLTPSEIDHWQRVLAAASKLQDAVPGAFLVGGSAVGIYTPYRTSRDADHLVPNLHTNWEEVLDGLKALAGWSTEVVRERHTIMGRLDGIETTLMNDDRVSQGDTLDIQTYSLQGLTLRLPTMAEMLRIKSYLLMFRNMARDYADCNILASRMRDPYLFQTLVPLEHRYRLRPHAAWSHDGTRTPLSFLHEMGLRLSHPAPRDLKKALNQWEQRLRLRRPDDLPSWEALATHCRTLGQRVLEVHRVWTDPGAEPELSTRYRVPN